MNGLTYQKGYNEERKLLMKISTILGEVGAIPKTGKNKFHGYPYHTEADINKAFQVLFSKYAMVLIPSVESSEMRETTTKAGSTEYIQKARILFTIMDAETGESLSGYMEGEGQDNGDKALYKAVSGVQKYFLMKTFMIQDQNDPEGDQGVDERNAGKQPTTTIKTVQTTPTTQTEASTANVTLVSESQRKMLWAKHKASTLVGFERINDLLGYNVTKVDHVQSKDVNRLIKLLDDNKMPDIPHTYSRAT